MSLSPSVPQSLSPSPPCLPPPAFPIAPGAVQLFPKKSQTPLALLGCKEPCTRCARRTRSPQHAPTITPAPNEPKTTWCSVSPPSVPSCLRAFPEPNEPNTTGPPWRPPSGWHARPKGGHAERSTNPNDETNPPSHQNLPGPLAAPRKSGTLSPATTRRTHQSLERQRRAPPSRTPPQPSYQATDLSPRPRA